MSVASLSFWHPLLSYCIVRAHTILNFLSGEKPGVSASFSGVLKIKYSYNGILGDRGNR
jgi:hypothetical protein